MRQRSRLLTSFVTGSFSVLGLAAGLVLGPTPDAEADILTCPAATTLDELATCIRGQMPGGDSNLYKVPTDAEQADFANVVTQMMNMPMNAPCDSVALPPGLASNYQIRTFTDSATSKAYCVLMEVLDVDGPLGMPDGVVDKGWGTFIVNTNATRRNLNQSAPHPIFDNGTENQAINIFQDTDSLSYLMCGSHRHANGATGGTCESGYGEADCAHQVNTMFHAAVVALNQFYDGSRTPWTHIQWHGKGATTCPALDVYGSQGFSAAQPPDSNVASLKDRMAVNQMNVAFELTGTGAGCNLNATDNVQGQYLNGATNICVSNAGGAPTNKFVHLEQSATIGASGAPTRTGDVWDLSVTENWPIR